MCERNTDWLLLAYCPAAQACVLTGNQTSNLLIHRLVLNPLRHTSQGIMLMLNYLEPVRFFWFYNLACVFFFFVVVVFVLNCLFQVLQRVFLFRESIDN